MKRFFWLLGFLLGHIALAEAHDPGLSSADLRIGAAQVVAHLVFSRAEIEALGDARQVGEGALRIARDGREILGRLTSFELDTSDALHIELVFEVGPASRIRVSSSFLPRLARGHRQYVSVRDAKGALMTSLILDAGSPAFELDLEGVSRTQAAPSFRQFFLLGLEHIFTGYDHLLFLLGLLIAGGGFWSAARIITSFTVAHSITLALATFDLVRIPPGVVEPLIAASILYVGLENLLRRDPKSRSLLTFGFGLVHGLGFASVLRELGIGAGGGVSVMPLLAFNLGVEAGQISVAALVLPLIWRAHLLRGGSPRFATACSALVALAGAFWLWERTLG